MKPEERKRLNRKRKAELYNPAPDLLLCEAQIEKARALSGESEVFLFSFLRAELTAFLSPL